MLQSTNDPTCLSSRRFAGDSAIGSRHTDKGAEFEPLRCMWMQWTPDAGASFAGRTRQSMGMEPTQVTDGRR